MAAAAKNAKRFIISPLRHRKNYEKELIKGGWFSIKASSG